MSEWPSTSVFVLGCSGPQWSSHTTKFDYLILIGYYANFEKRRTSKIHDETYLRNENKKLKDRPKAN